MVDEKNSKAALVFSGGLGLASYHAGAFEAFASQSLPIHWVSGSSAGAVAAALVAGNATSERIARFRSFWNLSEAAFPAHHPWRHLQGWLSAVRTHVVGAPGQFSPRLPLNPFSFRGLYDLAPMRDRLYGMIDFGRLNSGDIRISIATTDVETGDPVVFDSKDVTIEMDHLLASCGFLPDFAPVEIGGRMLVDGGLSFNAPFDPIFESDIVDDLKVFVIDLYARDGDRPNSLESAAERKNDLLFGNQTFLRLKDKMRLRALRNKIAGAQKGDEIYLLSYRSGSFEPGPEKSFNFSKEAVADRWNAGLLDMQYAFSGMALEVEGIKLVRRPLSETA
jgi:NTE family protein